MSSLLPARGRAGALIMMSVDRELNASDFANAAANPGDHISPAVVQKLHARHHRAARLLAEGRTVSEVSVLTDYTAQRISDLKNNDPAFQELVARYQLSITESSIDTATEVHTILVDVAKTAAMELRDRVEDPIQRKEMPINDLRQVAQFAADRTVAPPRTAQPAQTIPPRITFNIGTRDIRPTVTVENDGSSIIEVQDDENEPAEPPSDG